VFGGYGYEEDRAAMVLSVGMGKASFANHKVGICEAMVVAAFLPRCECIQRVVLPSMHIPEPQQRPIDRHCRTNGIFLEWDEDGS
jgi:hypothetical protein